MAQWSNHALTGTPPSTTSSKCAGSASPDPSLAPRLFSSAFPPSVMPDPDRASSVFAPSPQPSPTVGRGSNTKNNDPGFPLKTCGNDRKNPRPLGEGRGEQGCGSPTQTTRPLSLYYTQIGKTGKRTAIFVKRNSCVTHDRQHILSLPGYFFRCPPLFLFRPFLRGVNHETQYIGSEN